MNGPDALETPREILDARRNAAFEALGRGVMVLPAAPIQYSSRDTERSYRPDRELYYLTGVTEPGTVAVLAGGDEPGLFLFVREKDPEAELWTGARLGPDAAAERYGPDECHPLGELAQRLPELLQRGDRIVFRLGGEEGVERHVLEALERARARGARTGSGPRGVVDPGEVLDDLRLVKDEHELGLLRRAAEISVDGHLAGARAIAPGAGEWAVEAAVEAAFRASGGQGPGYQTIVGSGANACVLHYVENRDVIGEDALVLVDAGAECGLYQGDATRTYPAGGRFTSPQRDVYEVVEAALRAAVGAVAPGALLADVHDVATRVLVEGLVTLGVLKGDIDELSGDEAHKAFYPHQTSHWLGLDVHDPGDYVRDGVSRTLRPGMVFTVEPGLYFRPEHLENGPEELAGIGIRIEEDVAVTTDGCEVLTGALPTAIGEVEALVRGSP